MLFALLLAVVTIAFPKADAQLPYLTRCYLIGATDDGETNLVIQGQNVPVYRTGAFATVLDVMPGTNEVSVGGVTRRFVVAPKPEAEGLASAPEKVYEKLQYAGDVPKPHPRGRKASQITIVLDPGHGGVEQGALSPHGEEEKNANLRMAFAVRDELVRRGFKVVMTREDDSTVGLYDRPKVAHACGADAFVSIHYNAPGYSTDPRNVRFHAVYAWNDLGARLAGAINRGMAAVADPAVANGGVIHANFAVTRNPEIPSCLIEIDFITSPEGEEDTWKPSVRQRTAHAIALAIANWCD